MLQMHTFQQEDRSFHSIIFLSVRLAHFQITCFTERALTKFVQIREIDVIVIFLPHIIK